MLQASIGPNKILGACTEEMKLAVLATQRKPSKVAPKVEKWQIIGGSSNLIDGRTTTHDRKKLHVENDVESVFASEELTGGDDKFPQAQAALVLLNDFAVDERYVTDTFDTPSAASICFKMH